MRTRLIARSLDQCGKRLVLVLIDHSLRCGFVAWSQRIFIALQRDERARRHRSLIKLNGDQRPRIGTETRDERDLRLRMPIMPPVTMDRGRSAPASR